MLIGLPLNDKLGAVLLPTIYEAVKVAFAVPADTAVKPRTEFWLDTVVFSPGCSIIWIAIKLHTFLRPEVA